MKKITLLICLTFTTILSAQRNDDIVDNYPSTTIEEYNYLTKGYRIQKDSGLDMKSGYSFVNLSTKVRGSYTFFFKALKRDEKNEVAAILVQAYSDVSGKTYYLAMPFNNQMLKDKFEDDIRDWDESMTTAFAQAWSDMSSNLMILFFTQNKI